MLGNAVSSAVDRLYATASIAETRRPVQRVEALSGVRAAEGGAAERSADQRDAREQATQRRALTQGVRAVFETSALVDPVAVAAERNGRPDSAVEQATSDPLLEEAILRFIHTVFRSLAPADGEEPPATASGGPDTSVAGLTSASASRNALGARIGALAQRYADADSNAETDSKVDSKADATAGAATGVTASSPAAQALRQSEGAAVPDSALSQAFDDVMLALRGDAGSAEPIQNSRGDLVNLMHRLAQAMQGAPPVDPGLPTRGGLLSTRA